MNPQVDGFSLWNFAHTVKREKTDFLYPSTQIFSSSTFPRFSIKYMEIIDFSFLLIFSLPLCVLRVQFFPSSFFVERWLATLSEWARMDEE